MAEDTTTTGDAGAGTTTDSGNGTGGRTLTQDDMDREVGRRLAKEREKITKTYGDLDELKKAKDRLDEIEAAGKSELEAAQERLAALEGEKDSTKAQLQEARLEAAVAAKAGAKGIVDVDLALAALSRSDITVDFDDKGKPKDIDGVLDELVKQRPALTGKTGSTGFDGGARGSVRTGGGASMDDMIRARRRGR